MRHSKVTYPATTKWWYYTEDPHIPAYSLYLDIYALLGMMSAFKWENILDILLKDILYSLLYGVVFTNKRRYCWNASNLNIYQIEIRKTLLKGTQGVLTKHLNQQLKMYLFTI